MTPNSHDAIIAIYPDVVSILGDTAYDKDGQEVAYDVLQVEAKLEELKTAETVAQQNKDMAKQAALVKLMALGLTEEESLALGIK